MTKPFLLAVFGLLSTGAVSALAQAPAQPVVSFAGPAEALPSASGVLLNDPVPAVDLAPNRRRFESDHAFDGFIGPMSNPILSKDPRSLTEARLLFLNNVLPPNHALGGGAFQVYALQLRAALTERLTFIADKDGIASIHAKDIDHRVGLLNMNFGLKYAFVRDVENQFLWTAGFTYEPPMGYRNVFENHGNGVMSIFTTAGKETANCAHVLHTFGYQFGLDPAENSSFFYNSFHIDKRVAGNLYPFAELNWFAYTAGGSRGLPPALGEGDGLLNLGTTGVAGNHLVTAALGLKAKLGNRADAGVAWEVPLSNRHDLIDNRLILELILRY